ncbi:MAG: hypothetical protein JO149_00840, partial [Gammaproteobacteria bacterium]|nr:hypothetical protein [Gammaproteobacteria bacterium]
MHSSTLIKEKAKITELKKLINMMIESTQENLKLITIINAREGNSDDYLNRIHALYGLRIIIHNFLNAHYLYDEIQDRMLVSNIGGMINLTTDNEYNKLLCRAIFNNEADITPFIEHIKLWCKKVLHRNISLTKENLFEFLHHYPQAAQIIVSLYHQIQEIRHMIACSVKHQIPLLQVIEKRKGNAETYIDIMKHHYGLGLTIERYYNCVVQDLNTGLILISDVAEINHLLNMLAKRNDYIEIDQVIAIEEGNLDDYLERMEKAYGLQVTINSHSCKIYDLINQKLLVSYHNGNCEFDKQILAHLALSKNKLVQSALNHHAVKTTQQTATPSTEIPSPQLNKKTKYDNVLTDFYRKNTANQPFFPRALSKQNTANQIPPDF